jgi:hypothetical protein
MSILMCKFESYCIQLVLLCFYNGGDSDLIKTVICFYADAHSMA